MAAAREQFWAGWKEQAAGLSDVEALREEDSRLVLNPEKPAYLNRLT